MGVLGLASGGHKRSDGVPQQLDFNNPINETGILEGDTTILVVRPNSQVHNANNILKITFF